MHQDYKIDFKKKTFNKDKNIYKPYLSNNFIKKLHIKIFLLICIDYISRKTYIFLQKITVNIQVKL